MAAGTFIAGSVFADIIRIPRDIATIQEGINNASTGDTILIAPGTYNENIRLTKALTVGSEFLITGDPLTINKTIIDGRSNTVFTIEGPKDTLSSIVGLTIRNGEDGFMVYAPVNLLNNIIINCSDGIDYETGGGGLCEKNRVQYNGDDGIDLDGTLDHIVIGNNIVSYNVDDGIEIRLHSYTGEPSYCKISNNEICHNFEDGIQFIDYPDTSNRIYIIERNLIYDNRMAGIGCMDNGDTDEDYRGASISEPIYLFNNTISGHEYGITGSTNMLALNNVVANATHYGVSNFTGNSVAAHNLFYNNGGGFSNSSINEEKNWFEDPLFDEGFKPGENSPCINHGTPLYVRGNDTLFFMDESEYTGIAPDIGAIEYTGDISWVENVAICEGESWKGWNTEGEYEDTLTTVDGHDSIVTIHLTVYPVYHETEDVEINYGESYKGWTTSGPYSDTLVSVYGCDSIVTTNLTVFDKSLGKPILLSPENNAAVTQPFVVAWECSDADGKRITYTVRIRPEGYGIWAASQNTDTVTYYTIQGVPDYVFGIPIEWQVIATNGQDTTCSDIQTVIICGDIQTTEYVTICNGDAYEGWTTAGIHQRTLPSVAGCDSVVTTILSLYPSFVPEFVVEGDTLMAADEYTSYHSHSGTYMLVVTDENGCQNSSEPVQVILSASQDIADNLKYAVVPNPNQGDFVFRIESGQIRDLTLKLMSATGQVIEERTVRYAPVNYTERFTVAHVSKGIYFLVISSDEILKTEKIILQ